MAPETALHALRIVAVDVANLTSQNAVFRAHVEEMQEALALIDPTTWQHRLLGEGEFPGMEIILPPYQEEALLHLLGLVQGLG